MLDIRSLRPKGMPISEKAVQGCWNFYDQYAQLNYGMAEMSTTKIDWDSAQGVPIDEQQRNKYAEQLVKQLQDNPDLQWTYIATGDMFLFARCDEHGNIEVDDLIPRRWAFIENGKLVAGEELQKCFCPLKQLLQSGCQCGGN